MSVRESPSLQNSGRLSPATRLETRTEESEMLASHTSIETGWRSESKTLQTPDAFYILRLVNILGPER